ncbi:MAG: N-acetylmuramoyl-L-alanine amidase [Deltaproteobacteria bacterium]|nr:MAG: N-acetylmuramoyl-L-alanine amidase [Deltaproteobacteria bacterium]
MRKKHSRISILLALALLICFCGGNETVFAGKDKSKTLLKQADKCRDGLFSSAKQRKYRHRWMRCIQKYDMISTRYPKSEAAPWALFKEADLYKRLYRYSGLSKDLEKSIELFRKVAEEYPDHRLADDAQYRVGEIFYYQKKDLPQSYIEFLKVDIKFPKGDMRSRARARLEKLSAFLGKKEEARLAKKNSRDPSKPVYVKDIRHWSTQNYTRVVVDMADRITYRHHLLRRDPALKKPGRLYLDLINARVSKEIDSSIPIKGELLQRVRAGQYRRDRVRVVLDINSIGSYKIFHLYDPFRIVVDVRKGETPNGKNGKKEPRLALKKRHVRKGIRKSKVPDTNVSLARQLGLNVKRIVIDPGHGGKDPGCYRGKIREKDIVLSLARRLARKVKKEIGCEVYLTRNRDVFLPLERRTAIANMKKADLFISLHVNAHRNRRVRGIETYFLNMATDKNAVMLAARENATSEKSISDLQKILNDLMLNTKIHESSRLAHHVEKGLVSDLNGRFRRVKNLGVKQAPFYVLIGAQMPAILVETGFLTNAVERKRLVTKTYQEEVAQGICDGIKGYIKSIDQAYQGG